MKTIDLDLLIQQLNWRYAVKKFDATKKIRESDWGILEEVLRLSPSSYGLQPWKFIVIQGNTELRKKLRAVSWNQSQVEDCSHFVVITTLKKMDAAYIAKYIKKIADVRGVSIESLEGFSKSMAGDLINGPRAAVIKEWGQRQSYIAMGNIMNAAALMGIDACPLEGLDPAKYDEILGLTNGPYATVAAVAVGYRHPEDKLQSAKKIRFDKNDVIEYK